MTFTRSDLYNNFAVNLSIFKRESLTVVKVYYSLLEEQYSLDEIANERQFIEFSSRFNSNVGENFSNLWDIYNRKLCQNMVVLLIYYSICLTVVPN